MQRALAAAGLASRRGAEAWIRAGRVRVNGRLARIGDRVDPARDALCVDGERVVAEPLAYWLVNKPAGVVTTVRDPQGRRTVLDLLPPLPQRLFPVGRLDRDTEGLLLLTNDGPLTHGLLHPSHGVEREYEVVVRGRLRGGSVRRLAAGVELEDGRTAPARVEDVRHHAAGGTTALRLTLVEGRRRQIRRSLRALGHPVVALRRVRLGPLRLGRLAVGAARSLSARECAALQRAAGLGASRARSSGRKAPLSKGKGKGSKKSRA